MLKLYYAKGTCSSAVYMTAKSLDIELELVQVNIVKAELEDGSDYKKITAKGYVPALQLENGEVITEVVAICAYLASLKGDNAVFPLFGKGMIDQLEWFNYIGTEIHKNYMPLFFKLFGMETGENWDSFTLKQLNKRYELIEKKLANQPYLTGETVTSTDFYLLMTTLWAVKTGYDLSTCPNVLAFKERMMQLPVVQQVLA
ncbi:glutathione binding-like protein [Wohlfahrtiimonas populi]|uniref:glutathione binding-like protein n=1 Tax=Wohlfahrtiimonas populi TaxID=1940240 RepID=UPI001301507D|nr:glutathione binding-like protein [Wohlfahrtiimonas populi]